MTYAIPAVTLLTLGIALGLTLAWVLIGRASIVGRHAEEHHDPRNHGR